MGIPPVCGLLQALAQSGRSSHWTRRNPRSERIANTDILRTRGEWWRHGHVACPLTGGAGAVREGPLSQWVKRRSIRLSSLWASMPGLKSLKLSKHNVRRPGSLQRPNGGCQETSRTVEFFRVTPARKSLRAQHDLCDCSKVRVGARPIGGNF